jgi:hypothetical protein
MRPSPHPIPHRPKSSPRSGLETLIAKQRAGSNGSNASTCSFNSQDWYDAPPINRGRHPSRSRSPLVTHRMRTPSPASDTDFFGLTASPTPRNSCDELPFVPLTTQAFVQAAKVLERPLTITSFGRTTHYPAESPNSKAPIALMETFGHYVLTGPMPPLAPWAIEQAQGWSYGRNFALALLRAVGHLNDGDAESTIIHQVKVLLEQIGIDDPAQV